MSNISNLMAQNANANKVSIYGNITDTATIGGYLIEQPEIMTTFVNEYGDQGLQWLNMMQEMGFVRPTPQPIYSYWYDDWHWQPLVAQSMATFTAGFATVTLATGSITAGGKCFPQENNTVYLTGRIPAIIKSMSFINSTTITAVLQINASTDSPVTINTGDKLMISGNKQSEASNYVMPSIMDNYYLSQNQTTIINNSYVASGSEMASGFTWFSKDQIGNSATQAYIWENMWFLYRHQASISLQMLTDKIISWNGGSGEGGGTGGIIDANNTNGQYVYGSTNGFLTELDEQAQPLPYNTSSVNLTLQMKTMDNYWVSIYSDRNILSLIGNQWGQIFEDYNQGLFAGNAQAKFASQREVESKTIIGGMALESEIEFTAVRKYNRNYNIMNVPIFDGQQMFNLPTLNGSFYAIHVPVGKEYKVKNKMDSTDSSRPSMGIRYLEAGGYSRFYEETYLQGAGPGVHNIADDLKKTIYRTECGAEHTNLNAAFFSYLQ